MSRRSCNGPGKSSPTSSPGSSPTMGQHCRFVRADEPPIELKRDRQRQRSERSPRGAVHRQGFQGIHPHCRRDARADQSVLSAVQRQAGTLALKPQTGVYPARHAVVSGGCPPPGPAVCRVLLPCFIMPLCSIRLESREFFGSGLVPWGCLGVVLPGVPLIGHIVSRVAGD